MSKTKSVLLWILAVVLMLSSAVYQRMTGPTYPVRGMVVIESQEVKYKLLRSHVSSSDALVKFDVPSSVQGKMEYRRYKSNDDWMTQPLIREDSLLIARIPKQPPAGKVMYQITLADQAGKTITLTPEPVIIRFKGDVPAYVLIPHIIFMFLAMVYSMRTGLEAIFKGNNLYKLTLWTSIFLFLGGIILGPIVQKYAFGAFWTGWPIGHDLTDNKTAVAMIFWIIALFRIRKHPQERTWVLVASIVLLAVYMIPHSVLGSEIDYTKLPDASN